LDSEQLEAACIARVNADSSFDVIHNLRRLREVFATRRNSEYEAGYSEHVLEHEVD